MSDDKENSEEQAAEKTENGIEKINNDKNVNKSGSRAPSRAKSRGSIGDQRKVGCKLNIKYGTVNVDRDTQSRKRQFSR